MNPGIKVFLMIFLFYILIQFYRILCRRNKNIPLAKYLESMCPRCVTVIFAWIFGIFILPPEVLAILIGISITEFSDIAMKNKKSFLLTFAFLSLLASLFYITFEIMSEYIIFATITGSTILLFSLQLHKILSAKNKTIAAKIPTALISMWILASFYSIII